MKKNEITIILLTILLAFSCGKGLMSKTKEKHKIPPGLDGVRFTAYDTLKIHDISCAEALKIRNNIDSKKVENKKEWFFREFDRHYLIFVVARYKKNPVKGLRPWGAYISEKVYRIKRSSEAESALGVTKLILLYEKGRHGIKAGMSQDEVEKILGKPLEINQLGPSGSFDFIYKNLKVRFLDFKVAYIWQV